MKTELSERLYSDFPALFRGRHKPAEESGMSWGFQCDDGWYELLHELSARLNSHSLAHPALEIEAFQVKRKFGALRFQLQKADAVCAELVEQARLRSLQTCELSGAPGSLCVRENGRRADYKTLSPAKALELGYRLVEGQGTCPR